MRYFTSDPHFGHKRIIELCNRPFRDVDHMNTVIVNTINAVCEPDDDLWILGDVVMGSFVENIKLLGRLAPRLHLVAGNHDRIHPAYRASDDKKKEAALMYMEYFETMTRTSTSQVIAGQNVLLNHFPYEGDSHGEDRYSELRPEDNGLPLIHGHVHNEWRTRGRQFNVGVDVNNFRPVHEDTIAEWVSSL